MVYTVNIKCTNGDKYKVEIEASSEVSQFKKAVEEVTSIPADSQRLIYKGHVLKDTRTVESYGMFIVYSLFSVPNHKISATTPSLITIRFTQHSIMRFLFFVLCASTQILRMVIL